AKTRAVNRVFTRFIGVDLGGGKGKNTALARLELVDGALEVAEVGTGHDGQPWYDEKLLDYLGAHNENAVLAIDAPLTLPAGGRCREALCPGMAAFVDPRIVWFRKSGADLIAQVVNDRDRIVAVPANGKVNAPLHSRATAKLLPAKLLPAKLLPAKEPP